jgi:hypothetical protein
MPRIPGTTNAQTTFLRAFRTSPTGPVPDQWPSPAILRKWLRKPRFRAALNSLCETLRFKADFHLTLRAAQAAQSLGDSPLTMRDSDRILRLSHMRQRFPAEPNLASPATFDHRDMIENVQAELDEVRSALYDPADERYPLPPDLKETFLRDERELVEDLRKLDPDFVADEPPGKPARAGSNANAGS